MVTKTVTDEKEMTDAVVDLIADISNTNIEIKCKNCKGFINVFSSCTYDWDNGEITLSLSHTVMDHIREVQDRYTERVFGGKNEQRKPWF